MLPFINTLNAMVNPLHVAQASLFGAVGDDRADVGKVGDARSSDGSLGAHLEKDLRDEQASKSVRWANQSSKTSKMASSRPSGSAARRCDSVSTTSMVQACSRPVEERDNQVVLGREMPIESGLGNAGR